MNPSNESTPKKFRFIVAVLIVCCICSQAFSGQADPNKEGDLFEMSLEELMNVEVSSATLTDTTRRLNPAAVTTITREQIDRSAARSLDELLEIYVPGLQLMIKSNGNPLGIRGIINDRNNKYLLLVNGNIMNNISHDGAISERFLSMLGDIEYIDVVRGPGSAIYGPGAVAGVISIHTYDSTTFEGTDVQIRQGAVERFSTFEVRHTHKFADDSGLFIYYGVDNYRGADQADSPLFFSHDFTNTTTDPDTDVGAHEEYPLEVVDNNRSYRNRIRHKFHAQYTNGGLDAYLRYTRGGIKSLENPKEYRKSTPESLSLRGYGYQQLSGNVTYDQPVNDEFRLNYRFNYDMFDYPNFLTWGLKLRK